VSVRIRMKKMGRTHRPFFRICAVDRRRPRGGKVLEELGTYDPMVLEVDARAILNGQRIQYWLSVGAEPSEKVRVLIKKYGADGTHLEKQKAVLEKLAQPRAIPEPGKPASLPKQEEPPATEAPAAEAATEQAAGETAEAKAEAPSEAAEAGSAAPAEEKTEKDSGEKDSGEEKSGEEKSGEEASGEEKGVPEADSGGEGPSGENKSD